VSGVVAPRFPSTVDEITPALLTAVLAEGHPGVEVSHVRVLATSEHGDGHASTADRILLALDYAPGRDGGLPSQMLVKTFLGHPHAPAVMYRTEVRFYRDIRPELAIEAPRAFAGVADDATGQFGLLMEDLTLRGARFPNALTSPGLATVTHLVETLAELHAHFWSSPRFRSDLAWVATPCAGGMADVFKTFGLDLVRKQLEFDFKAELLRPLGRPIERLWADLWRLQSILETEPVTLLHGDPHIGNTYVLPDGRGGLLDWQLMVRGRWAHDLTYLIVTGLTPEDRRTHERSILARYLDALARRGVEAPDAEAAWLLYRQSVVWGLVIGWLITPPRNYGEAITAANLTRLVAAAQDLETFRALG
jgi:hypothetical protein